MMTYRVFAVLLCLVCGTTSQGVGQSCIKNGVPSVCRLLRDCQADLSEIRITRNFTALQQCGFVGHQPVTCCTELNTTTTPLASVTTTPLASVATTPLAPVTTTPLAPVTTTPLAPVTTTPLAPVTTTPLAPVTTTPLAPVTTTPLAPVTTTPLGSVATSPLAPVTTTPLSPVTTTPLASVATSPLASVTTSPLTSVATTPLTSAATTPLAPVTTTPLAPVTTTPLTSVTTTPLTSVATTPLASVATTPLASVATTPLAPGTTTPLASVATTPRPGSTTTEYVPQEYDYVVNEPLPQGCAPLRPDETVAKIGRRAWDKCIEYHEQLVRPCERSVAILGGLARSNHCVLDARGPGMWNASRDTAPYAAMLGYERPGGWTTWRCSGALISDRFILCAAHCAFGRKRNLKPVAMVGSRKSSHNENRPQLHRIKRIIRHPQYRRSKHSDIALVETQTTITLDRWTVPACLDVFGGDRSSAVVATWISDTPDLVQKVSVQQETREYCTPMLEDEKRRRLDVSHVCYGEDLSPLDICHPDTWGPLTISNPRISCMHSVIGVSSIGVHCSMPKLRYITMVEHYVPWIEAIVWP